MSEVLENTIYVSEKAKAKVKQLMLDAGVSDDPNYFFKSRCGGRRLFRIELQTRL